MDYDDPRAETEAAADSWLLRVAVVLTRLALAPFLLLAVAVWGLVAVAGVAVHSVWLLVRGVRGGLMRPRAAARGPKAMAPRGRLKSDPARKVG